MTSRKKQNPGFEQTVNDIKALNIQGAENVAKEAVKSLGYVITGNKDKDAPSIIAALKNARKILFATRPTEPCMRNSLNFTLSGIENKKSADEISNYVCGRMEEVLAFFNESENKITDYGSEKIKDRMIVYTHCHSSTVTKTIIKAWQRGKHVEVHNTETRPRFQGRITSTELASKGIPVVHYVDSAMRFALKKADIMLIGADAITVEGKVINKVGSELAAEIAERYDVPVYVCANSWKFDPATIFGFEEPIEKRYYAEVWEKPPRGVRIDNFAFEQIDPKLITGVITEIGIYKPPTLVEAVKKKYPWMIYSQL